MISGVARAEPGKDDGVNESSRKSTLILGTVAAVAGVAVLSYLLFDRVGRSPEQQKESRSVSDVLSDCYMKIHDLKERLSELHPANMAG
jgi:hypothetical protein